MAIGVYGIFDAKTNECLYIGMSKNIEYRWKQHLKILKNKKHPRKDFVEWFYAHGAVEELLSFRILEECKEDNDILNKSEIEWFNKLKPKFYGKEPSLNEQWIHSDKTKEKISKSLKKLSKRDTLSDREQICLGCKSCFKSNVVKSYCSRECYLNNSPLKKLNAEEIDELYSKGMSLKEIAKELNVSCSGIHYFMTKNGIQRRNFTDSVKNSKKNKTKKMYKFVCSFCNKISETPSKKVRKYCSNECKYSSFRKAK